MIPQNLTKKIRCIYLILGPTGKIYVGKTKSAYHRCHQYLRSFRNHDHSQVNYHLLNAVNKYGIEMFEMIVWEDCDSDEKLTQRELYWIDFFNSTNRRYGYNLRRDSRKGMITHPETSKRISERLKGEWSNGVRKNHGDKLRKRWSKTPERKNIQADIMKRALQKYTYKISHNDQTIATVEYRTLKTIGLGNALNTFSRKKTDLAEVKGFTVERLSNEKT